MKEKKVKIIFTLTEDESEMVSDHKEKMTKKQLQKTEKILEDLRGLFGFTNYNQLK